MIKKSPEVIKIVLIVISAFLISLSFLYADNAKEYFTRVDTINISENQPVNIGEWFCSIRTERGLMREGVFILVDSAYSFTYTYEGVIDNKIQISSLDMFFIDNPRLTIKQTLKTMNDRLKHGVGFRMPARRHFWELPLDENTQAFFPMPNNSKLLITLVGNQITVKKISTPELSMPVPVK